MPGVALVNVDRAVGLQLGLGAPFFRVNGNAVVVIGDSVEPHAPFVPLHTSPVMVEGTPSFRVGGIPVCREGHKANCGHATTGRSFFRIP